jgi:acid stress-induced BolA-like protein IbaG/YrbA
MRAPGRKERCMQAEDIQALIEGGIPGARARVTGDGRHFEAVVVAAAFAGRSSVQRHQLVYRALGARMDDEIHALSIKAMTPDECGSANPTEVPR